MNQAGCTPHKYAKQPTYNTNYRYDVKNTPH